MPNKNSHTKKIYEKDKNKLVFVSEEPNKPDEMCYFSYLSYPLKGSGVEGAKTPRNPQAPPLHGP